MCHASAVEIRCRSRIRDKYIIRDNLPSIIDGDGIIITNSQPVENVTTVFWKWHTMSKTLPSVLFETFPNLGIVDLTGMNIEIITQNSFHNADNLKFLKLETNNIRVIPEAVFKLAPNLVYLDLDDNQITKIQDWALTGLTELEELQLSRNQIKVWTRHMLAGVPRLEKLYFNNNGIETIEDGAMALPMLEELYLKYNRFKTISNDVLAGAPLLKHLDLTANMLTEILVAMRQQKQLTHLGYEPIEKCAFEGAAEYAVARICVAG